MFCVLSESALLFLGVYSLRVASLRYFISSFLFFLFVLLGGNPFFIFWPSLGKGKGGGRAFFLDMFFLPTPFFPTSFVRLLGHDCLCVDGAMMMRHGWIDGMSGWMDVVWL